MQNLCHFYIKFTLLLQGIFYDIFMTKRKLLKITDAIRKISGRCYIQQFNELSLVKTIAQ